jgi:hypothetical protein
VAPLPAPVPVNPVAPVPVPAPVVAGYEISVGKKVFGVEGFTALLLRDGVGYFELANGTTGRFKRVDDPNSGVIVMPVPAVLSPLKLAVRAALAAQPFHGDMVHKSDLLAVLDVLADGR